MTEKKEDRRIRRTKRLLRQSLAELMNEKDFRDITVKEISERADLNRGTFYFHYKDTYDLKDKVENEMVEMFRESLVRYQPTDRDHSVKQVAIQLLNYMSENRFLYTTLTKDDSSDSLRKKFMLVLEETINRVQTEAILIEDEKRKKYNCRFLANGIAGAIDMWLNQNDGTSLEEMAGILDNLIGRIFPVV